MASLPTILLAEDDTTVRDVVIRVLSEKGYGVLTAAEGHEALRIMADRSVDLLFTDIVLPGMDGVQLAQAAKAIRPAIKVLFATSYPNLATERDAMRYGKILYKPLSKTDLLLEVEAALASRKDRSKPPSRISDWA